MSTDDWTLGSLCSSGISRRTLGLCWAGVAKGAWISINPVFGQWFASGGFHLDKSGSLFSYKLRYIVGFGLVEMAISTNPKPTIYRNLYDTPLIQQVVTQFQSAQRWHERTCIHSYWRPKEWHDMFIWTGSLFSLTFIYKPPDILLIHVLIHSAVVLTLRALSQWI